MSTTAEDNRNALKHLGQYKVHTHIGFERAYTREQAEAKLIGLKAQLPHAAKEQPEKFYIEGPPVYPKPTINDTKDLVVLAEEDNDETI